MIEKDATQLTQGELYKLMIGAIVPRPIAWVSTQNKLGKGNLAPFSFFNGVSSNPPCISLSITRNSKNEKKDTLKNIEETQTFCIHIVSEHLTPQMNQTAAEYPFGVNEATQVGLTSLPCKKINGFRISESLLAMECRLFQKIEIGNGAPGSASLVIGEILYFHIHESIYKEGKILTEALKPIARLAGSQYASLNTPFSLDRPILPSTK